jgi:hypothetical protein
MTTTGAAVPGKIIRSSGNVFADMGMPDAATLDTNARLGAALNLIVERQRLMYMGGWRTPRSLNGVPQTLWTMAWRIVDRAATRSLSREKRSRRNIRRERNDSTS